MASHPPSNRAYGNDHDFSDMADMRRDSHDGVNVFSDEFAEEYPESVHTVTAENPFLDTATQSDGSTYEGYGGVSQSEGPYRLSTRSSVRRSGNVEEAPYLGVRRTGRTDESGGGTNKESQGLMSSTRSTRSLSVTSSASFAPSRASTVHAPTSGPSHAYGAYPQGFGVYRSESIASTSTGRPSRGSSRRGPLHAYGLYPQNALESIGTGSIAPSVAPPSDTAGRHNRLTYQDSIRSSAPSEQLPAYTQFPDEMHTKIAAGPPLRPTSHRSMASQMEDRSSFTPYTFGLAEDDSSADTTQRARPEPAADFYTEKQDDSTKSNAWLKGRACGFVPRWTIILGIAVVVLIAVICGGVIGSFVNNHKTYVKHLAAANSTGSTTSAYALPDYTSLPLVVTETTTQYIDATPIATPTSVSALPTGTFQVNIDMPATISNSSECLNDPAQRVAWSCDMDTSTTLNLQVIQQAKGSFLAVDYGVQSEISYGTQPPALYGSLALVNLLGNASLGPAFHFQTDYDKLVILPGDTYIGSYPPSRKREAPETNYRPVLWPRQIAFNDNPWFCWFNDTSIEGFIFVNHTALPPPSTTTAQPSQADVSMSVTSLPSTFNFSATTTVSATLSGMSSPDSVAGWPSHPLYYTPPTTGSPWAAITRIPSTTSCEPTPTPTTTPTPTPTPTSNGGGQWSQPNVARGVASSSPTSASTSASTSTSTSASTSTPPGLPMLFRLEERRASGAVPAACTQMARIKFGQYAPIISNGAAVVRYLNESDPQQNSIGSRSLLEERDSKPCFCVWET